MHLGLSVYRNPPGVTAPSTNADYDMDESTPTQTFSKPSFKEKVAPSYAESSPEPQSSSSDDEDDEGTQRRQAADMEYTGTCNLSKMLTGVWRRDDDEWIKAGYEGEDIFTKQRSLAMGMAHGGRGKKKIK